MHSVSEETTVARRLRFRVGGDALHVFKHEGESLHHTYLKVLAYALYQGRFDMVIEPRHAGKPRPDVAHLDLTGQVAIWIFCGDPAIDQLAHVLKHSSADEVIVIRENGEGKPFEVFIAQIRRQIHYRYINGTLKVLEYPPLDEWFDPDDVEPREPSLRQDF